MTPRPIIHSIDAKGLALPKIEKTKLSNGVPLMVIPHGDKDLVKIDIGFKGGTFSQPHPFVANFCINMMKVGTSKRTSKEISEMVDYLGATLAATTSTKYVTLDAIVLERHLTKMLELLCEIITTPAFPEAEFELRQKRMRQEVEADENTVFAMADRAFNKCLYGDTVLGNVPTSKDVDKLQLLWVKDWYTRHIKMNGCQIYLSGNISEKVIQEIDRYLGSIPFSEDYTQPQFHTEMKPSKEKRVIVTKEDSVQSCVMLGKHMLNKDNPDLIKLMFLNTVLGGYFGSRLMSNIREEKGYTYGINSAIQQTDSNYDFQLVAQCANQFVWPLIDEVYKEMERLCEEPISQEELELVKNYQIGRMCRCNDGTFSIANVYILNDLDGVDASEFSEQKIKGLSEVTSEELMHLARKYFTKDSFYEVVAGNPK